MQSVSTADWRGSAEHSYLVSHLPQAPSSGAVIKEPNAAIGRTEFEGQAHLQSYLQVYNADCMGQDINDSG